MKKNKWAYLLAGFLVLIIIATFTVENIYYDSLPTVEKVFPGPNILTASYSVKAAVIYGRKEYTVRVESAFSSISLLLDSGAKVWEGLPIYSVSLAELRQAIKILELSIFDLAAQNEELMDGDEVFNGRNALLREKNLAQIEILREKLEKLAELYEDEGIAYALHSGYIHYDVYPDAPVQSGQKIAVISYDTGERFIKWQMPAAEGMHMEIGGWNEFGEPAYGIIDVTLFVRRSFQVASGEILATVPRDYRIIISKIEYDRQNDIYELTAQINEGPDMSLADLMMEDGTVIDGISRYISRDVYEIVIPTDAISFDNDLRGTVYVLDKRQRIYGEEYFVRQMSVEAVRILNNQAALRNAGLVYEVVTASDKPLAHNMAVKLVEPLMGAEE